MTREVQTVGVVGAGVMGQGLAQDLAQSGHSVVLLDISEQILQQAEQAIRQNIRFQGFFKKQDKPSKAGEILTRISFATDLKSLDEVEFVFENVPEKWDLKQEVYAKLDAICDADVIFAANTSCIPITRIASATERPAKVIGTHFMNPVPLKTMVEVACGAETSEETLEVTRALLARMGKQLIIVKDSPGFVSNRVLMLSINEAIFLLQEQVASAEEIDRIFTSCFGHKQGPLATADLIGLDTILYSLEVLADSVNYEKFQPCPLLKEMVDNGLHGRKSGRGFYDHDGTTN
jgi:3-hydroxybutyryl-CoA dehydrogenase